MNSDQTKRNVLTGVLVVGVTVAATLAAISYVRGNEGDFIHFFEAALAVRRGENIYASFEGGYVYPPLFAVMLTPLSLLPMGWAGAAWAMINGAMIIAAARLCAREMVDSLGFPDVKALAPTAAIVGLLIVFDKGRSSLSGGQTDALVLLMVVLALRCTGRWPMVCGLAIAMAMLVKFQAVIFVPYLFVRGRWREGIAAIVCTAVLSLSTSLVFGWERNLEYLNSSLNVLREVITGDDAAATANPHGLTWDRSVSLPSAIARVVGEGNVGVVIAMTLGLAAIVAGVVAMMYRARGVPVFAPHGNLREPRSRTRLAIEWAGLVVAVVVFSPQTEARHMLLTVPMTTIAAVMMFASPARSVRWLVAGAMGVVIAGLYLPPGGEQFRESVDAWRAVGGASWCMLAGFFCVLWVALPRCRITPDEALPGGPPLRGGSPLVTPDEAPPRSALEHPA